MHTKNNYTFPLIGEGVSPSPYFLKQFGLLLLLFLNYWGFSQPAIPPMLARALSVIRQRCFYYLRAKQVQEYLGGGPIPMITEKCPGPAPYGPIRNEGQE